VIRASMVFCLFLLGLMLGTLDVGLRAQAQADFIILQSTTSTKNSGLYDHILPLFTKKTGINVRVVAVGTGQALKNAMNGDGDVILVHAKPAEEKFVADGHGVKRHDVMYNDFVLIGPPDDPAGIRGMNSAVEALAKVAQTRSLFASRGDDSGTHKKEVSLWRKAGVEPDKHSGEWYREMGAGMGATLNAAVEMGAYTLTDRGTWISFKNKRDSVVHVEGDDGLFNQYGVILVNPERHPEIRARAGQTFIDWIVSKEGQEAIASYRLGGEQLFFPNAGKEDS